MVSVTGFSLSKHLIFYPDKVRKCQAVLSELSIDAVATLLIGDAASDMRAGKELGLICVAAGWGNQDSKILRACQPEYFCSTPLELRELLEDASAGLADSTLD